MILESISLKNFRQYYGLQRIMFAKAPSKNVTVIHGENGHGKTALLNAFTWCLYGQIDLPNPERLLNERAEAEAKPGNELEVSVILQFKDADQDYTVTRSMWFRKSGVGNVVALGASPHLSVEYTDTSGRRKKPDNPQNTVDQLLPERLKQYFFFDGERIDNLSKEANTDQIQEAIKNLMGLEVLERSLTHLNEVRRRFRNEQKEHGSLELQALLDQEKEKETQIETYTSQLKECDKNVKALEESIGAIEDRLRELNDSKEDQLKRDQLEQQRKTFSEQITSIEERLRTTISSSGHLAFCETLLSGVTMILDEKRAKGEISAGIKEQFVDDLIESGTCICGRDLVPGSLSYHSVMKWKQRAGSSELEDQFIRSCSNLKVLENERGRLFDELKRLKQEREAAERGKHSVSERIDEISERLSRKDSEVISDLEKSRQEKRVMRNEVLQQIGALQHMKAVAERDLKHIKKQIAECEKKEQEQLLSARRAAACEEARSVIQELYDTLADVVRQRIQERLDEIYGSFLRKGYIASLSESYQLQIMKEVEGELRPVPMSQGERQITSLSFIGALVDIAREQHTRSDNAFFRGGIYPIVMDSPFGALDPDHKTRIATGIPVLAHQVVVLATDSQWKGEVAASMGKCVGAEYTLYNHQPKKDATVKYEYTEIKEGYHA